MKKYLITLFFLLLDLNFINGHSLSRIEENPGSRRKRELDYSNLPEAPSLPEFRLDILPDYIKAIIMEDPDSHHKSQKAEDLEKQVRDLERAVNHPPSVERENDRKNEKKVDEKTKKNPTTPGDKDGGQKREVRTYGMTLAGDKGEVWNDVNAHVSYHVGEPETTITTSITQEVPDTTTQPTDTSEKPDSNYDIDNDLKDIDDSFDEINKILKELIEESTRKTTEVQDQTEESDLKTDITEATIEGSTTEATTATTVETTTTETTEATAIKTTQEDKETSTTLKPTNEKPKGGENDEESKQKQFVKELMKNKYFWQWLQDSSTAYLEVMMKKVDDLIKAEVEKQIKQYFEDHKNITNSKPVSNNATNTTTEKSIQNNNVTEVTTQKPTVNSTVENPIESNNVTGVGPIISKELNNTAANNTKVDESLNNSNKTEEFAQKEDHRESNDIKNTPVKIHAKNVYGNSVGNEKVTNIFIFNIGKESDLDKVKPLTNGTNGVFVFGLDDKKPDQVSEEHNDDNTNSSKDINNPGAVTDEKEHTDEDNNKNKQDENEVSSEKPNIIHPIDEPKEKIEVSTSKTEATSDQITKAPDVTTHTPTTTTTTTTTSTPTTSTPTTTTTTTSTIPDENKEKTVSTTEKSELPITDISKDKTNTDKPKDSEDVTEKTKETEDEKENQKPESSTTSNNNEDKSPDNSINSTNDGKDSDNGKEETPEKKIDTSTTESIKKVDVDVDKDNTKETPEEGTNNTEDTSTTESTTAKDNKNTTEQDEDSTNTATTEHTKSKDDESTLENEADKTDTSVTAAKVEDTQNTTEKELDHTEKSTTESTKDDTTDKAETEEKSAENDIKKDD